MRRLTASAAAAALLLGGACSNAHEERREAAVDGFCATFGDYLGWETALTEAPGQDPRTLLGPLAGIDPPERVAAVWDEWAGAQRARIAAETVRASHGGVPFWYPAPPPGGPPEVHAFWDSECVAARGHSAHQYVSDTDPELAPYDEAPDGGGIRVVEQGLTEMTMSDTAGVYHGVSYAVVVENTSDHVAVDTEVRVDDLLDSSGRVVPVVGAGDRTDLPIPVLLPGQRFAIAANVFAARPGTVELSVRVGTTRQWWPADHEVIAFAEITTTDVATIRGPVAGAITHEPAYTVRYTIDSEYRVRLQPRTAFVVFRNTDGEIIGGGNGATSGTGVPPGRSAGDLVAGYRGIETSGDIDDSRTEVYL